MHKHLIAGLALVAIAALTPRADADTQQQKTVPVAAPHAATQIHPQVHPQFHPVSHPVATQADHAFRPGSAPDRHAYDARHDYERHVVRGEEWRRQERFRHEERFRQEQREREVHLYRHERHEQAASGGDAGADTSADTSSDAASGGSSLTDKLSAVQSIIGLFQNQGQ
ncbi:MAG TPA: hypothetical protein VN802_19470 [Stellaceae bacterium]|nr:hypothetical protein [Stellaceae bacterium]